MEPRRPASAGRRADPRGKEGEREPTPEPRQAERHVRVLTELSSPRPCLGYLRESTTTRIEALAQAGIEEGACRAGARTAPHAVVPGANPQGPGEFIPAAAATQQRSINQPW
jgi:hypothetical protein